MKQSKSQILKNALKSAVREVIQEELQNIRQMIKEELRNNKTIPGSLIKENTLPGGIPSRVDFRKFVMPTTNQIPDKVRNANKSQIAGKFTGNPLANLIADAGSNIQPEEYQEIINVNSSMAQTPVNMGTMIMNNQPMNISNDFGEMDDYTPPGMPNFGG